MLLCLFLGREDLPTTGKHREGTLLNDRLSETDGFERQYDIGFPDFANDRCAA